MISLYDPRPTPPRIDFFGRAWGVFAYTASSIVIIADRHVSIYYSTVW